ncbi:DUF4337 domain-containing protein [Phenylobacterium sp.]|jgi:hypothetical protein|uniref:DUF4337 domain-containing protein n=1 Tax=Phenylobacterium sp. TaxID=1871053 RepID=UPI002F3F9FC1
MEGEIEATGRNRSLNRAVAITVVVLSVFMGVSKVKDDNIVQAMQQAKSDSVDTWGEYQATRTKLHIAQTAAAETALLSRVGGEMAEEQERALAAEIAKYQAEAPKLKAQAEALQARYDALNVHDDQFDASDAMLSIAVATAAVAALVDGPWVLAVAWLFAAGGLVMGAAGFAGWSLHPDVLSKLLG